jgi:hypothetical protein
MYLEATGKLEGQKMEDINPIKESPLIRTTHLGVALGIALAVVTLLMWLLQGITNAGALAATLYVDGATGNDTGNCQNPSAPCDSIGYAISQAVDGDEILITAITYNENLTITGESLTLIGGYTISGTQWMTSTSETIVDGGQAGRVFFFSGSDSVLENLIITNGKSPDMECWGDGVWVTNGDVTIRESTVKNNNFGCNGIEVNHDLGPAHLTLESSTVSNNGLTGAGGGLHVWGEFASADIVDVEFIGNSTDGYGGGISVDNQATAVIKDSRIISNTANQSGGGIGIREGASAAITGTLIYSNTTFSGEGGGLHIDNFGSARLADSLVLANSALDNEGGGIGASGGSASSYIENSIIAGNTSGTNGGGLWLADNSTHQVFNSHIVGNETPGDGAAIAAKTSQVELTNTLIISNTGFTGIDDRDGSGSLIQLTYCDTYGNSPDGTTGVTINRINCLGTPQTDGVDPLMAGGALPDGAGASYALDWLNYDFHLLSNSPAIDSGTNVGAPIVDIDGNPRPIDGNLDGVAVTDMGAYEFRPQKVYVPILLKESE